MNEFEESLARLGDNESHKTRVVLLELDDKLYSMELEEKKTPVSDENLKNDGDEFMNYYRGYDAITENVDDKEIQTWKKTFPYLQVYGQCLQPELPETATKSHQEDYYSTAKKKNSDDFADEDDESKYSEKVRDFASPSSSGVTAEVDYSSLVVCGSKIIIAQKTHLSSAIEGEGEGEGEQKEEKERYSDGDEVEDVVLYSHGTLEEVIEVDNTPIPSNDSENIFLSIDPHVSHKVEVVNALYDVLIPDLVEIITPLVHRIVHLCREHGIDYSKNANDEDEDQDENSDCFYRSEDEFGDECYGIKGEDEQLEEQSLQDDYYRSPSSSRPASS